MLDSVDKCLVVVRPSQSDGQPGAGKLDVGVIERNQFGATEGASESHQVEPAIEHVQSIGRLPCP